MRYPDADIEVEYRKEKAKRKKKPFDCTERVTVALKEPRLAGAASQEPPWDPDAWDNSLKRPVYLTFGVMA